MDWRESEIVDRVRWREPYAMTRRRAREEWHGSMLLTDGFWGRIFAVSYCGMGVILLWAYLTTPGLVVPWNQMVWGMVLLLMVFVGGIVVGMYFPVWVDVRLDRIDIVHGQANCRIHPRDLAEAVIVEEAGLRMLRIVRRTKRGRVREHVVGIAEGVDVERLEMLLGRLREGMVRQ